MKFSCAIFFFALTIAAQFQHIRTAVSDELVQFKQTLGEAADALQDAEESPALRGNVELQRQRRKSIDDLLHNSELDLNLNLEREALDLDGGFMHPLQGRDTKNSKNKNNDEVTKKSKVNDQLNELVRANSRFQNLHRQLLNSFHNSNSNLKMDDMLQRTKASKDSKSSSSSNTNLDSDKEATKNDKEKTANKEKDSNNYSNSNKGSSNKNANSNKESSFISNFDWKSSLGAKDNFNIDMDFGKDGSIGAPYSQTFSKLDSSDSANVNSNLNSAVKDTGHGSSVLTKAYISCKPLATNAEHTKSDDTYMEFTSNLREPQPNKESNTKSNLNTILLLEANTYRNSLNAKKEIDNLEELNEKKVDPEVHRMMQKVDFPHFKLDFDSSMEDFAKKSKSDSSDDDEPISYEKTIENIHFPSIVNDQFDLGRNDLSHEADYKLSKIEQEQSEPRKSHTHSGDSEDKLKVPWKRSSGFNPMDEIKLKTSTRLMAKGLGPSLPSYALSETQQELQLDDAVKRLEKNFKAESEYEHKANDRHGSLVSQDILDWQERLKRLEDMEERSYEKLIYDNLPELSKEEKDEKSTADDVILSPTYTILRKRRIDKEPYEDDSSDLLDQMCPKRVIKNPCEDDQVLSQNLDMASPDDILAMQLPDLTPLDNSKALNGEVPAPEVAVPEIPVESQDDTLPFSSAVDAFDEGKSNEIASEHVFDENLSQALADSMVEKPKRCGEQGDTYKKTKDTTDDDERLGNKMTIFKFKRDVNGDECGNSGSKRRVKRIGVLNEAGEMTGIREVDLGGLLDLMTVQKLKPKREVNEKTKPSIEQEGKTESGNQGGQADESVISGQKALRRRRRELFLTKREIFDDDTLHLLNGCERKRRSLNKSRDCRRRREVRDVKRTVERQEKEKANDETEKVVDGKNTAKKSIQSQTVDERNSEHPMGKRAAHNVDEIADNNSDNRKIVETGMLLADDRNFIPVHVSEDLSTGQRVERPIKRGDNNSERRKIIDAVLYTENGNQIPIDQLAEHTALGRREPHMKFDDNNSGTKKDADTAFRRTEPLDDAAVIAADRRAMNAARAAYIRREGRDDGNNGEPLEVDYRDLMGRLRRLSLQNREREKERVQEREGEFSNSVGELGNQKFDNLKQVDQNAHNFDGIPVDNLWYGNDPWEEDNGSDDDNDSNNNNSKQETDLIKDQANINKNQPNQQRTALTIKIENGAIKSIERKEEPKGKENEARVVNEKTGSEEEEVDNNRDLTSFGWFGKSKSKENSGKSAEDGMVLKLNDQVLNCTAFNTLEGFLKSVQQQNKEDNGKKNGVSTNGGATGNDIGKGDNDSCKDRETGGDNKQGSGGQGTEKQGTNGHRHGGHEGVGKVGNWPAHGGGGRGGNGHSSKGHGGSNESDGVGHGDHGRLGCGRNGVGHDKKTGGGSGNNGGDGHDGGVGGSGNGLGPAGTSYGSTSNDGNSYDNSYSEAINMTVEIQPVTLRPMGSCGQKAMKLNITINASVMGDQRAKNFYGNGTIKVQSEERERRGISFPPFAPFKRYATKRKCAKPKVSCDKTSINGKGAADVVKSIFNMAKCNPQMKPLWASLKRNQQCMKKTPPQETGFEKMQKDDVNHIEDMVEQAMEAISDIIDDQVEQRSCIPLPPQLKIFYEQILDVFESNSAEGVREKRASFNSPFEEFSKEVHLIDPNLIEQRSRIVKKLLRQYEDLPAEEQQQMASVRDDLLQNLGFLESIKEEQTQKKREQAHQQPMQEQQREQEPEQQQAQPQQVQASAKAKTADSESDIQARRQHELLKQLEEEKPEDEKALKAYNLPYTPEFLRLLKASELMQEQDIRQY